MMKQYLNWFGVLLMVGVSADVRAAGSEASAWEMPRSQVVLIKNTVTGGQYELYIKLPENYATQKDQAYPVLYFTDAMWHIELLSAASAFLLEEAILVGISWQQDMDPTLIKEVGAHVSRYRDYSIRPSSRPEHQAKYQFGQASQHVAFIRNDVFKYIENNFRTLPDKRSYFGYSLGGEFGAYVLITQPDTFRNYILGSPSLKGELPLLTQLAAEAAAKRQGFGANVFISYGSEEQELGSYADQLVALLQSSEDDSLSLQQVVIEGSHQTAFPATGVRAVTWLSALYAADKQVSAAVLTGPYMGQDPPGMVAEPFAPGVISQAGWELEGVFAPGMTEFYYTTNDGPNTAAKVIGYRQENNRWQAFIEFPRIGEITFSPDGQRMYMAEGYRDREGDGWSDRQSLGAMFDREDWGIMRLSASASGTFVFDDYKNDDIIRISTVKDGQRQTPKKMGAVVNSGQMTAHPFIAPDESYLIWDSERAGGFGDSDLYISFRQPDGSWGPAINMGSEVNSAHWDAYASVTPDGKYMLFNRGVGDDNDNVDIYWVDAQIIERLRSQ